MTSTLPSPFTLEPITGHLGVVMPRVARPAPAVVRLAAKPAPASTGRAIIPGYLMSRRGFWEPVFPGYPGFASKLGAPPERTFTWGALGEEGQGFTWRSLGEPPLLMRGLGQDFVPTAGSWSGEVQTILSDVGKILAPPKPPAAPTPAPVPAALDTTTLLMLGLGAVVLFMALR